MSYLPSKTCFQSLRFTHCMPASLLSALPPPHPGSTSLSLGFIKSMSLSHSYCVRPIHRFRRISLSSFLSSAWPFFSKSFWPRSCLGLWLLSLPRPTSFPLISRSFSPPQPGVPHDFLRVVLSSVAALFLLPHPPHHHQPTPVGSTTPFFWPPRAAGPFTCCVHVISSPSIAISAPLSSRGGSPLSFSVSPVFPIVAGIWCLHVEPAEARATDHSRLPRLGSSFSRN